MYVYVNINSGRKENTYINELNGVPYLKECLCSTREARYGGEFQEFNAKEDSFVRNGACSTKYRSSSLSYTL
jgi:hypothetical protein